MIVDSSALVALVFEEPGYAIYVDAIANAELTWMSAASLLETCVVINREKGAGGLSILSKFIAQSNIQIVPLTEADAGIAFGAYLRFGKGMGHPARLNILDSCSYALAARLKEPLLFKGTDFSKTDVTSALL